MNGMYLVPIFRMEFLIMLSYLQFREKQLKKRKIALIEKEMDPSLLDSKPRYKQNTNNQNSYKIGLLLIVVALGVMFGYILNLILSFQILLHIQL
jgi:hypothetical protein